VGFGAGFGVGFGVGIGFGRGVGPLVGAAVRAAEGEGEADIDSTGDVDASPIGAAALGLEASEGSPPPDGVGPDGGGVEDPHPATRIARSTRAMTPLKTGTSLPPRLPRCRIVSIRRPSRDPAAPAVRRQALAGHRPRSGGPEAGR